MKHFLIAVCLLIIFMSFIKPNPSQQNKDRFLIKGEINGLKDGAQIFLVKNSTKDTVSVAVVQHEQFQLEGKVPNETEYYFLQLDTTISLQRSQEMLLVNENLTLTGKLAEWPKVRLEGSAPQNEYMTLVALWQSFEVKINDIDNKVINIYQELSVARKASPKDTASLHIQIRDFSQERQNLLQDRKNSVKSFIKKHPNSSYIGDLIYRMDFTENEKLVMYDGLAASAKNSYFGTKLKNEVERIRSLQKIKEGTIIPDFIFMDIDNKMVSLHETMARGKVTLLDFWASWCKPCRQSFPKLRKIYEEFRKDGFNIVSIALNDEIPTWKRAINNDSIGMWTHGIENGNVAFKMFDIPAIPSYMLIDESGKIIAFDAPGSSVKKFGPKINGDSLANILQYLLRKKNEPNKNTSQVIAKGSPVQVGEKVPDIELGELINHPTLKNAKISDFRGKLLILDFWSTWCKICIAQFPKIQALREKYGDKVEVLPVGFDAGEAGSIKKFMDKLKREKSDFLLPSAVRSANDSLLIQMFPFSSLPMEVWISAEGKLLGLTDHTSLNEKTIESIVNNKVVNLPTKKLIDVSIGNTFLLNKLSEGNIVYGSAFAGYIDTLGWISSEFVRRDKDSNFVFQAANLTLQDYYSLAYKPQFPEVEHSAYLNRRVRFDGVQHRKYRDWSETSTYLNLPDFRKNNTFAYELRLPSNRNMSEAYQRLISDLDNAFGFKSKIENRQIKCYVLIKKDSTGKLPIEETGNILPNINTDETYSNLIFKKISINEMMRYFNSDSYFQCQYPVFNETNIQYPISMSVPIDANFIKMRVSLNKYGLDLKEVTRPIKVIALESLHP